MQALAVVAALLLCGYGFAAAGWRGALTGIIAAVTVGSGLAILRAERGTDVDAVNPVLRRAQRIGGIVAALGACVGAIYGGWHSGWLWALPGYALGMGSAIVIRLALDPKSLTSAGQLAPEEQVKRAALRILHRGSRNPPAYLDDPRSVLRFACSSLSNLCATSGSIEKAAATVGEDPESARLILETAGYDVGRLAGGEPAARLMYALEATNTIFRDVPPPGQHGADAIRP